MKFVEFSRLPAVLVIHIKRSQWQRGGYAKQKVICLYLFIYLFILFIYLFILFIYFIYLFYLFIYLFIYFIYLFFTPSSIVDGPHLLSLENLKIPLQRNKTQIKKEKSKSKNNSSSPSSPHLLLLGFPTM